MDLGPEKPTTVSNSANMTDARREPVSVQQWVCDGTLLERYDPLSDQANRGLERIVVGVEDYRALADRLAQVETEKADMVQRNQILRTRPDLPMTYEDKVKYKELEQQVARLREFMEWAEQRQPEMLALMRKHNIKIDNLDDNMQKFAFTVYTELCEVNLKAIQLKEWLDDNEALRETGA